jgi:hypothetical protein
MLVVQTEEITISLQYSAGQYNTLYSAVVQIRIPSPGELYHQLNINTLCILSAQYSDYCPEQYQPGGLCNADTMSSMEWHINALTVQIKKKINKRCIFISKTLQLKHQNDFNTILTYCTHS